jgi:hypothetical protein
MSFGQIHVDLSVSKPIESRSPRVPEKQDNPAEHAENFLERTISAISAALRLMLKLHAYHAPGR